MDRTEQRRGKCNDDHFKGEISYILWVISHNITYFIWNSNLNLNVNSLFKYLCHPCEVQFTSELKILWNN